MEKLKMNEIKNEKRLTFWNDYIDCYEFPCENCPRNGSDCRASEHFCEEVLADRLAKYEDIGRDVLDLSEDEVIPVSVLEMSFKVLSVLATVSEQNKLAKAVFVSVLGTIDKLYGKKAGEKDEK